MKDAQPIAGSSGTDLVAGQPGSYACEVTARNAAGSTSQTSAQVAISTSAAPAPRVKLGKLVLDKSKGTAVLLVNPPEGRP
ncbi:MAG: hypothetical protein H0X42_01690 [Solirubrobacterales bacterium]|nr:hypothetical protein [Solirubrobacterales bacterium]